MAYFSNNFLVYKLLILSYTNPMKILRIEHRTKKNRYMNQYWAGPYGRSGHFTQEDWTSRNHADDKHPIPSEDKELKRKINRLKKSTEGKKTEHLYICGFKNKSQLKKWFSTKERATLKQLGFIIAEYQAESCLVGQTQCIFIPSNRRKITEL